MVNGDVVLASGTTADTSDAFDLAGECKIIASGLSKDGEYVKLLEEYPDGVYREAVDKNGVGVILTSQQPSQLIAGYGSYKLYKTASEAAVAAAVVQ